MTVQQQIRANAEMVVEQMRPVSNVENFGYNAESVVWVDGFIERQRVRPDMDKEFIYQLTQTLGSYLGECIIACYGGSWQEQAGTWAVVFDSGNFVFPFNKVNKQFLNGCEDSIASFFDVIPLIFTQHLKT